MDWNAELVDQLEWHWQQQLRPRLAGLTDDEYFWQPVPGCWTLSRRGASSAAVSLGAGEFTMDYAPPPHVRGLGAAGLARPQADIAPTQCADAPMAKRILHIHREVIHHGAEICLLRDLYLWKADGTAL
ncbi:MAG TPA: hypothetical protein VEO01_28255 [Pseudonocardiaceae bacterium]|nr:hypothetical protein [Pseudonocardiaceae bacterium]